jgi:hypothetical protein
MFPAQAAEFKRIDAAARVDVARRCGQRASAAHGGRIEASSGNLRVARDPRFSWRMESVRVGREAAGRAATTRDMTRLYAKRRSGPSFRHAERAPLLEATVTAASVFL